MALFNRKQIKVIANGYEKIIRRKKGKKSNMKKVKLSNEIEMPILGFGVFQIKGQNG
jgi:hypothetical protein